MRTLHCSKLVFALISTAVLGGPSARAGDVAVLFGRFEGADGGGRGFAAGHGFEIGGDAALRFEFGGEFHDAAPRKRPEPRAGEG